MYPFGSGGVPHNNQFGTHQGPYNYPNHPIDQAPYYPPPSHHPVPAYSAPNPHPYPNHITAPSHGYNPPSHIPKQSAHMSYQAPKTVAIHPPPLSASYASQPPAQSNIVAQSVQRMLKIDMMKHAWAVIESDFLKSPIFVPPNRTSGAADGDIVLVTIKTRPDGKLYAKVDKILTRANSSLLPYSAPFTSPSPVSAPSHTSSPSSVGIQHYGPADSSIGAPGSHHRANSSSFTPSLEIWTPSTSTPLSQSSSPYTNPYGPISPPAPRSYQQPNGQYPTSLQTPSTLHVAASLPLQRAYSSSSNTYANRGGAQTLPPFASVANTKSASVGYQAIPTASASLVDGVLMMESATVAYVVPHQGEKVIHIPKEFLSGASNGEIVRVHVIPARSTPGHLVGAIVFVVGLHPSMTVDFVEPNGESSDLGSSTPSTANFYPDLEHWSPGVMRMDSSPMLSDFVHRGGAISPSNSSLSLQHAHSSPIYQQSSISTPPPNSTMKYPVPANHGADVRPTQINATPSVGQLTPVHGSPNPRSVSGGSSSLARVEAPSMSPQLTNQLKQAFQSRAKTHPPTMSFVEFSAILDTLGEVEPLTRSLFDTIRRTGFKTGGSSGAHDHLPFEDFSSFVQSFLYGDESNQLTMSFSILDPQQLGVITKDSLRIHTENVFRLMLSLLLPVYLANPVDMTEYVWLLLNGERGGHISMDQYLECMKQNRNAIIGLGLAQMPSTSPMTLPRRGIPVYPGSSAWPLVIQMMTGLSRAIRAVEEGNGANEASNEGGSDALTAQAFRLCNRFELHTVMKVNHKLTFTDFAPAVFKKIRALRGIDDAQYLYALGIEQLLGNFFFGRLTSLAKEVSTGKSGQLFFTSHDGRFLIKTVARHERNTLYKMLPSYLKHLQTYPNSLLVPIYGLHDIDQLSIIVMGNVFNSPYPIETAWDLKGSIIGRSSPNSFIKKDLDFDRGFVFGPTSNAELARQIRLDAQYLKSMNIVDYSLLTGYHTLSKEAANTFEYRDLPANAHPYFDRGLRSYDAHGTLKNELWFMGIIDILIQFGVFKKAENFVKSLVHDSNAISIIPPDQYCDRFSNYLVSCIK